MCTMLSFLISISPFHYFFLIKLLLWLLREAKVHLDWINFICDLRIIQDISSRNLIILIFLLSVINSSVYSIFEHHLPSKAFQSVLASQINKQMLSSHEEPPALVSRVEPRPMGSDSPFLGLPSLSIPAGALCSLAHRAREARQVELGFLLSFQI